MNETLRLGRIAGIPIGINWTWAIIFVIFAWSLAEGVFPTTNPGLGTGTYVAMALVAELLFFASLVLHELGHAVVARREGMRIDGITLWLFGGVARFSTTFPNAGAEFRIAIAGPVVSAVLGAVFVAFAALTALGGPIDGVASWLGYINLLLLAFNLLPALPLDGGRVFRAVLWKLRNDYGWATRISARVGRGFGALMIAGGVVLFVFDGQFGDLWLALIGWFLFGAAQSEARFAAGRAALDGLVVGDVMTRSPIVAPAKQPLQEFVEQLGPANRHPTYPVVDGVQPVGLLVLKDVAKLQQRYGPSLRVRDAMTPLESLTVIGEHDPAFDALGELLGDSRGHALVFDGDALTGVVALSDFEPFLEPRTTRPGASARSSRRAA
jgi:Zn-dependent protease/CBS domain-containing protein